MTTALSSTRPASLRSLFYPFFFSRQMERGTGTSLITRNQHLGLLNKQHYSLPLSNNSVSLYIYKEKHFKCVFKKMLMKYPQRVRISSVSPVRRLSIYIYTVFAYIHIYICMTIYLKWPLCAVCPSRRSWRMGWKGVCCSMLSLCVPVFVFDFGMNLWPAQHWSWLWAKCVTYCLSIKLLIIAYMCLGQPGLFHTAAQLKAVQWHAASTCEVRVQKQTTFFLLTSYCPGVNLSH